MGRENSEVGRLERGNYFNEWIIVNIIIILNNYIIMGACKL
jgi:hypothetical protein